MEQSAEGMLLLLLPEDLLADILRRLPPHSLAVLRCASGALRAFVDARRLLRKELPHTVASLVVNFFGPRSTRLLSHPSAGPATSASLGRAISVKLDHLQDPSAYVYVRDHCNGLLLIQDTVVNPATRQSALLPPLYPPTTCQLAPRYYFYTNCYVAFDPAVSPHYEVLSVPFPEARFGGRPCDGSARVAAISVRHACLSVEDGTVGGDVICERRRCRRNYCMPTCDETRGHESVTLSSGKMRSMCFAKQTS